MVVIDIYKPDQWQNFFIMVGGATAALTGLVFVALSLNLTDIAKDATHRYRAIGTLAGFIGAFMICALALMGNQNYRDVGMEWLIISVIAATIYMNGIIQSRIKGGSMFGTSPPRVVFGTSLYLLEVFGALIFVLGHIWGLYMAAVILVVLIAYTITGAWLLVIGVHEQKTRR